MVEPIVPPGRSLPSVADAFAVVDGRVIRSSVGRPACERWQTFRFSGNCCSVHPSLGRSGRRVSFGRPTRTDRERS